MPGAMPDDAPRDASVTTSDNDYQERQPDGQLDTPPEALGFSESAQSVAEAQADALDDAEAHAEQIAGHDVDDLHTEGEDEADAASHQWFPEEDDFGPFGEREQSVEETRRSPAVIVLALVIAVAVLAAAFWFLAPPEWRSRLGIAQADESPLQLMLTHSQRQELASGNILLAVTGRVINPTDEMQTVPPIQAELRKKSGELVYSWTISPPARSIAPGGRAPFNSAEMNVPADGDLLTITFGAPKA